MSTERTEAEIYLDILDLTIDRKHLAWLRTTVEKIRDVTASTADGRLEKTLKILGRKIPAPAATTKKKPVYVLELERKAQYWLLFTLKEKKTTKSSLEITWNGIHIAANFLEIAIYLQENKLQQAAAAVSYLVNTHGETFSPKLRTYIRKINDKTPEETFYQYYEDFAQIEDIYS